MPEQRRDPGRVTLAETCKHARDGVSEILDRLWSSIEGGKSIDEHDLAIKPCEVTEKEGLHDFRHVGIITPLHERAKARAREVHVRIDVERREGEERRAGKVARHQEATGWQRRQRYIATAAPREVRCEEHGGFEGDRFFASRRWVQRCEEIVQVAGKRGAR